ncbi:MAG: hypothetical protein IH595_11150 [Bacteroidales bacterium]|nr:hypothetical protein [Bacteroidales bacterium]
MANFKSRSEAQVLENYRVALENVETQAEIAATLTEFGYDNTVIANGKQLYEMARQAFDANKTEDQETNVAYDAFDRQFKKVYEHFVVLRKKLRIIFRNDPVILKNLGVSASIPHPYAQKVATIRTTLQTLNNDTASMQKMAALNVTPENISTSLSDLEQLDKLRATYLREKGESQAATMAKDSALGDLGIWMRDFLDVARIALEDNPQLLESLNVLVRN